MKIRSIQDLQEYLDNDLAWRRKELTTMFLLVSDARKHQESVYIRSAMNILYAHWEGYIKNASLAYLSYICFIGRPYGQLKRNFIALGAQKNTHDAGVSVGFDSYQKIAEFFSEKLNDNFKIVPKKVINTESNLNTKVLKDIFRKIGLEYTHDFELNEKRIDDKLLGYRNKISHGEKIYDLNELKDAFSELKILIIKLLENVRDQIVNSAELKLYMHDERGRTKASE